jgi:hypothetical protein
MNRLSNFLSHANNVRVSGLALALTVCLAAPLRANTFFFETGSPNGQLGALSQRPSAGRVETETADDFFLQDTTVIRRATIVGLIPTGSPLESIKDVEVEMYEIFSPDNSDASRTSGPPTFSTQNVPTRVNSPADVEIDTATRERAVGTLEISPKVLSANFMVANTVVTHLSLNGGSEGPRAGEEVEITITFTSPIILPAGHYFFRPEVLLSDGDFLFLSGGQTPVAPDLQAWIRNSNPNLAPDWLRIGTDIIGGGTRFNMAFSLTGETVPDAGTPGQPNCQGQTISALAHQFGNIDDATPALGFSSVHDLQNGFALFCE